MKYKSLNYFKGKVCTVFTNGTNRNFKEENPKTVVEHNLLYFMGVVEEIDEMGILLT